MKAYISMIFIKLAAVSAVLMLLQLSFPIKAAPAFELMKDFDAEKLQNLRWWVTHRAQRLRRGHLDRCLAVTFNRRFNNHQLYMEIDHESSGAIDKAYYPADFDSMGFTFKMDDNETGRIDIVDTDYTTYFIGYLSLEKRKAEFLFTWANVSKPEGALLEKMSERLMEIAGVGMDALEPVDNDNCPETGR
ncbi:hypothetical protein BIW11_07446 [Tropilaelaps mercedesae]|uniref:Lipocalin/cytosolic fatty-acid binding domain-containing protein n=1 Tax=Tropilaelaps mercedesae TaxID=418985 RepID=A0A1V9XU21_9ACAR|nr:hypothetical protein BIW11_07446 [Tropilaelaps mercedesae]